jgi:hypothetical protein
MQQSLSPIQSEKFTLSIYFGRNMAKRYDRLSLRLFNLFQAPLIRVQFARNGKWSIRSVAAIATNEVPESHAGFLVDAATEHFAGRGRRTPRREPDAPDTIWPSCTIPRRAIRRRTKRR